jgi:hypothetical protein
MDRQAFAPIAIGTIGLCAAAVMGVLLITDDDDGSGYRATESGFVIEPSGTVGPDAFTPSVDVGGEAICDTEQFVEELTSRPDAVREWSRVLGVPESGVAEYVSTLRPAVLTESTAVTNHGLRDGSAYARPSMLESGTAVLMGTLPTTDVPPEVPPPDTEPPPTTDTVPPTTTVDEEIPITRCRCGNPLLPPYAPTGEEPPTTTTSTTTTTLDEPSDEPPQPVTPIEPSQPGPGSTPSVPEPSEPSVPDPNNGVTPSVG